MTRTEASGLLKSAAAQRQGVVWLLIDFLPTLSAKLRMAGLGRHVKLNIVTNT